MSRRIAAGLTTAVLVVAGCASTAQRGSQETTEPLGVTGVAAPETLEPLEGTAAKTSPNEPATLGSIVEAETQAPTGAELAFVAGAPPSPPAEVSRRGAQVHFGPGVSPGVIRIGAPLWTEDPDYLKDLGYDESVRPHFKRVWSIVIEAINSTGGILGRRVKPVYLGVDPSAEELCTFFTEQEPVIAVAGMETGAAPCLEDAGVLPLSYAYTLRRDSYREAPRMLTPTTMSHERAVRLYVDGLHAQRFFEGNTRIGLVRWDTAEYAELSEEILKPALARHGLRLTEELSVIDPRNDAQLAQAFAEGRAGVQRFKQAGIDRVLILDVATFILPHFTQFAEEQRYYPRYGLNSLNGGEWEVVRSQLKGAVGIGWMPWLDLEPERAYRHGSEGARRCKDLMDAAGATEEMDTYNEALWTSSICDLALFLKAAVEAGGPSITADSIVAGAESLGTSFQASNTLVTRFAPGRHEGVAAIRFLRWFVGCQCFRYTSGLIDAG